MLRLSGERRQGSIPWPSNPKARAVTTLPPRAPTGTIAFVVISRNTLKEGEREKRKEGIERSEIKRNQIKNTFLLLLPAGVTLCCGWWFFDFRAVILFYLFNFPFIYFVWLFYSIFSIFLIYILFVYSILSFTFSFYLSYLVIFFYLFHFPSL